MNFICKTEIETWKKKKKEIETWMYRTNIWTPREGKGRWGKLGD